MRERKFLQLFVSSCVRPRLYNLHHFQVARTEEHLKLDHFLDFVVSFPKCGISTRVLDRNVSRCERVTLRF